MRLRKFYIFALIAFQVSWGLAQQEISIDATLKPQTRSLDIVQEVIFTNTSNDSLTEIYFNDWANSFSAKTTPLAERFGENFNRAFQFEKDSNRGRTQIYSVSNSRSLSLEWERGDELDILVVKLDSVLLPGQQYKLKFQYNSRQPDASLTRYGVTRQGDYKLKYWYLTPAVYQDGWQAYSNKNSEDLYQHPTDYRITFNSPRGYFLVSDLDVVSEFESQDMRITALQGDNRMSANLYLERVPTFSSVVTDKFELVTNMDDRKVTGPIKALAIDRILFFMADRLGEYPFDKMVISQADYKTSPVYGLNQLPNFISPFPAGFEYEIEMLKTVSRRYIENTLPIHPRKDHWLIGAIQIHLMMEYVDQFYPDMKVIGNVSDWVVIRWTHLSELEFNDQYPLLYLNMARNNLHQSLVTPKDSLVKFNKNIASDYYAGDGLQYLADYLGKETIDKTVKDFYQQNQFQSVGPDDFQELLESNTELPVNWFFEDYVGKKTTIDFKIKKVKKRGDSLEVRIANLKDNTMPISLYGINRDSVLFKKWIDPIRDTATVMVPREGVRRLVVNYEGIIPEFNQRNNYRRVTSTLNRPVQVRLFQDVEDPRYGQVFVMPVFGYNIYDGLTIGPKLYNKTLLRKGFHYKLEPQYALKSNMLVGSASLQYTDFRNEDNLFAMRYGISGSLFSYNVDLLYRRLSPYMTFAFRPKDLRSNEKQFINLRSVTVARDLDPNVVEVDEPNYSVFNFQYVFSNPNLINYFRGVFDYQLSDRFSKLSTEIEYRKLFLNNRQINLRFFAGVFLFNDTRGQDDFFSFALDRPTDYLFDYNYYGRSEDSGLFSQQLIIAEGGFKSQLEPAFADSWIATVNASANIWKWIFLYGDAGLVHNKGQGTQAVFDTGVRLNLVEDYFELYFPLYSSLGWEPGLGNYDKRIRFIVTLSLRTLFSLFTREWY